MLQRPSPLLAIPFVLAGLRSAGQGTLDDSFNGCGFTFEAPTPTTGRGVALQADGRIVAVGQGIIHTNLDFVLVCRLPDGTPDPGFGTDGIVALDMGQDTYDVAQAVAIQPDGRIVVSGLSGTRMALARFDQSGALDSTFGVNGIVLASMGSMRSGEGLALQPDGRILVCGRFSTDDVFSDLGVARFTAEGSADSTFDADGIRAIDGGSGLEFGAAVAVQPDGRILLAGTTNTGMLGDDFDLLVARLEADGSTDAGFGDGGITVTHINNGADWSRALTLLPDGRFVVAGSSDVQHHARIAAVRYDAQGSPDGSFGESGIVVAQMDVFEATGSASAILPNGDLLVAGTIDSTSNSSDIAVLRFDAQGILVPFWGSSGIAQTNILGNDFGRALVVQPDGNVVVAGSAGGTIAVVRYLNDLSTGAALAGRPFTSVTAYPNPARGTVHITYALPTAARVTLRVVDGAGRTVGVAFSEAMRSAGTHEEALDLTGLGAGSYAVTLNSASGRATMRVVLE